MSNHKRPTQISFDDSLTNEDYGLIIGKNGELKGIWIPTVLTVMKYRQVL